ncbi:hypothetical protein LJC58_09710 [Lachnospiraceae bacterium OttesenSCG-928-D06]|nr:hypothetical protein [Lachnospiraceae bacterium OttesenSCG-928-D06]
MSRGKKVKNLLIINGSVDFFVLLNRNLAETTATANSAHTALEYLKGSVNITLTTTGGNVTMSDDIAAKWASIANGWGCVYLVNGFTILSGTYIKYSNNNGSMTLTDAQGNTIVWTVHPDNGYKIVSVNQGVTYGNMTANGSAVWIRSGSVVTIQLTNVVPVNYTPIANAPKPAGMVHAAVISTDGRTSIWHVYDNGSIGISIGDTTAQYTGTIVYMTRDLVTG